MKRLFFLLLCIVFTAQYIEAQDCTDVTLSATTAPSDCQSNGSITVSLSGSSVANLVGIQYSVTSTTGSISVGPISSNVFNNLPSGTYRIEVVAVCSTSGRTEVYRLDDVVIGGSYVEPRLSFVSPAATSTAAVPTSRNSYAGCNLGIIVVYLEDGNQTGMPTFRITSAPAGVTVPQVVSATKATSAQGNGWRYTLDGTWPVGTYTVAADDGCQVASTALTILDIGTIPVPSARYLSAIPDDNSCNNIRHTVVYDRSDPAVTDLQRYLSDGLYEYGAAPVGEMPTSWNSSTTIFSSSSMTILWYTTLDLSPHTYSDFYASNSLTVYTRLKACPSIIDSYNTKLTPQPLTNITDLCTGTKTYTLSRNSITLNPSTNPNRIICYPLTILITDQVTGATLYNDTQPNVDFRWPVNSGERHFATITDASGYQLYNNYLMTGGTRTADRITHYRYYSDSGCSFYYPTFYITPANCHYPNPFYLTITDDLGTTVLFRKEYLSQDINEQTIYTTNSLSSFSDMLLYDTYYRATVEFTDGTGTIVNTVTVRFRHTINTNEIPTAFTLSRLTSPINPCLPNYGQLRVTANQYMRGLGSTVITITGPAGYIGQTSSNAGGTLNYSFPQTDLPPGLYTATIESCGTTYSVSVTFGELNVPRDFGYTLERRCDGTVLTPQGQLFTDGSPVASYYRIINGPPGGFSSTQVITAGSGGSFLLTTPGVYVLALQATNATTGTNACAVLTDTIIYNPMALALDRDLTSAYACPGATNGYLTLQAINGVAPYTYTIYDATNTTQVAPAYTTATAYEFTGGTAEETYTVRVSDACGNSFEQRVTLAPLNQTILAYGSTPACYGGPINLGALSLANATYSWTGPDGFTSNIKNPVIANATEANEGWYYLEINDLGCGITVNDSIYISVYDKITDLDGTTQEITLCPLQQLQIGQAATGGSGSFTYQWAYSSNGTTYTNLSGETNPVFTTSSTSYIFSSLTANPSRRYLRLTIMDTACGNAAVLYYHTNVKECMLLVNPNLRSQGSI
ncbi:hypothetical protein [Dysgonomonas sp. GY617]|uniref:hypothetical protein n=1 Tax=Dysgonomonas sp. GY617 TaxID=2780420 RepID=UPI0018833E10|nr:hypothetical protein [Dysgonomonas sp. GY617]MBF0575556.1 hypothetical protein [Dysgonomonas sp. GY617]